jgi:hypothetical protein
MAKKTQEPQTIVEAEVLNAEAPKSEALATQDATSRQLAVASNNNHLDPFLAIIERAIMLPDFDVAKLAQLLDVRERWEKSEAQKAFTVAINKFKQNPPKIEQNREVGFESKKTGDTTSYRHATLDQVCDAIIKELSAVGVSHKWRTEQPDKATVRVTCVLRHELGATDEATLEGPPDTSGSKNAIQAIASTVTYLERYTLLAVCGLAVAGTDTDGSSRPSLAEIECPACKVTGALIIGKPEYGGGFVCFKKKGGCGEKFDTLPGAAVEGEVLEASSEPKATPPKKFAGVVKDVRKVELAEHPPVLILKVETSIKRKGKNNKWSTVKEENVIVAEQSNFIRVLEKTLGNKVEVECSQQPGSKGKAYWRIEKILAGGAAVDESAPKEPSAATPAAEQEAAEKPAAEKVVAEQPAPRGTVPVVKKVPRVVTLAGGKKKDVEWTQVRGKIICFGSTQKGNVMQPQVFESPKGSKYMVLVIEGLPDSKVPENQTKMHDTFHCWHRSLHEAIGTAKPGDSIVFCYEAEVVNGRVYEQIEDIEWINGTEFLNGKPVMPGYGEIPK